MVRKAWLGLFMVGALAALFSGCGVDTGEAAATASPTPPAGDDDDDGNPTPTPEEEEATPTPNPTSTPGGSGTIAEVETNDDHATANPVSGNTIAFSGACGELSDAADIFYAANVTGTVTATVTWTESAENDIDLFVSNDDYSIDEGDIEVPPGDSPATISATFAGEDAFVEVSCLYVQDVNVTYTGTITIQ